MLSSYYSYDFDPDEILSNLALSAGVIAIIVVIFIIGLIIAVAFYILNSIGLYKMAKKVGYRKAWLAWIPYANTWLMFNLPTKEYRVLALNKVIPSRNVAFWIWLAISVGGAYVASILGVIPYLGVVLLPLGELAVAAATVFMIYPMYKDLFLLFYTDSTAQGYALACTVCSFIAPIVPPIIMLITSSKAPREIQIDASYTVE